VGLGRGRIQAEGDAAHAGLLGLAQARRRGQGGGGGRERAAQTGGGGVRDQLEEIGPHHRIAAGEDQDRAAERRQAVDQLPGLVGGELGGVAPVLRVGAAVHAGEGAGACDLPGDGEGRLVEVGLEHVAVVQGALGGGLGREGGVGRGAHRPSSASQAAAWRA
jgi:hypothetical protein